MRSRNLFAKRMVLGTANLTVEMVVGGQLSATVSEGDLRTGRRRRDEPNRRDLLLGGIHHCHLVIRGHRRLFMWRNLRAGIFGELW